MDGNNNGWMASLTQWTWFWAGSGSWWWTGKPAVLQFMGLQRVGHDWATELNWQKQPKFISHSSGDWKSVIIVPECLGSGESPLMGCRHLRLAVSSGGGRRELWFLQSLIVALILFTQAHPLNLITARRSHILIPSHWALGFQYMSTAAAAAKLLQSCPTLCDPMDGSPPGSPVPGILQARTLEWVAISFSNTCKWKVKVKSLSSVRLSVTPRTAAYQTLRPWDFPGKSTGVGFHCLLWHEYWGNTNIQSVTYYIREQMISVLLLELLNLILSLR